MSIFQLTFLTEVPRAGTALNVTHWAPDVADDDKPFEQALDLATKASALVKTDWAILLGSDCSYLGTTCKRIYPLGGPTAVYPDIAPGGEDDPISDSGVCVNCELIVDADPYESGHLYFPGVPGTKLISNQWNELWLEQLQALLALLVLPLVTTFPGTTNYKMGVWNRKTHTLEPIVATQTKPKPTSLNKRMKPYL